MWRAQPLTAARGRRPASVSGCQTVERSLPLTAQLSAALTAFTIEADNEAERRIEHHTTDDGGARRSVWLTSLAMWFNCLRGLSDGELTVAELERRARMSTNLDGMRRWGYITIDGTGRVARGRTRPKPRRGSMLALTERGRAAARLWAPLPEEIERRWRDRFGATAVDELRAALAPVVRAISGRAAGLPADRLGVRGRDRTQSHASDDGEDETALPADLVAGPGAADARRWTYERDAKLALALQLNGLRVLDDDDGVPVADLPPAAGVAKAGDGDGRRPPGADRLRRAPSRSPARRAASRCG